MIKKPFFGLISFAVLLLIPFIAFAQNSRILITGQVVDPSGAAVAGAQVTLEPGGISAATDKQGEFTVPDVVPGGYKLTVSYLGFEDFQQDLLIKAGDTPRIQASMKLASQANSVDVTAERPHGEAESLNQMRVADNLLQVLPAEVITSLPNANVADAIGRLPSVTLVRIEGEGVYVQIRGTEPRLTNTMIDGVSIPAPEPTVRTVRLDVIGADLVDSVEINKTLAANIDGDGIGGSVNLKTKTATDIPFLTIAGMAGETPIIDHRYVGQSGIAYGQRFGIHKQFGFLTGLNYEYNGRGIDNIQPAIDTALSTASAPYYDNITIREYRYYRHREGVTLSTDYRLKDFSSIYYHLLYSDLQDYGDKWYFEPVAGSNPKFYTSSKRPDAGIGSMALGARHVLGSSLFTWEVAASRSRETHSAGNPKSDFGWIGASYKCNFVPSLQTNQYTPQFTDSSGNNCDAPGSPLLNPANYSYKDITISTGKSADVNLVASASFSQSYHWGSHYGTFEVGGKIRNDHKYQDSTENVYDGWSSTAYPMTGFLSNFVNPNFFGGNYHLGPVSDFNTISGFTLAALGKYLDPYKTALDTDPNIFDLIERISAGYVMNTMQFGKLRAQVGVRFEATQMNTLGYNAVISAAGLASAVPVTNNPSYFDALPSVNLRYSLTNDSALRLSYGRGISRPDPYQLVPYSTEDDSVNPATYDIGNPSLRAEHANNYDLLYEQYLKPIGMVSAGVFCKQLTAPLYSFVSTPTSGMYLGSSVTQWMNGTNAHLCGLEGAYIQHLSFLPSFWSGLGLSANYSWTESREKALPGRPDSPALQAQAPNTWNFSPTYDKGRLSSRVGWTYNGASISQYVYQTAADPTGLGPKGPAGDIYYYPHLQLDAQMNVRLAGKLHLIVYGLNLTNEVFGYYNGNPQYVNQREFYKPTYAAGLKYTFNHEK